MKRNSTLEKMKKEILQCLAEAAISVKSILLFGSRARKDHNDQSDYDFLIITENTFEFREKMAIAKKIRTRLSIYAIDVLIKSEEEVKRFRTVPGNVVGTAIREGIRL